MVGDTSDYIKLVNLVKKKVSRDSLHSVRISEAQTGFTFRRH